MKDIKEITINGDKLLYEQRWDPNGYGQDYTEFYLPEKKIRQKKKYYFFGPLIDEEYYEAIYKVYYSIEDCDNTKEAVREDLERRHTQYVSLLGRCEEIKRGEII